MFKVKHVSIAFYVAEPAGHGAVKRDNIILMRHRLIMSH